MSTIKQKVGICIECPKGSKEQPLTAKRCGTHYWKHRANESKKKHPEKNKKEKERRDDLNVYFGNEIQKIPPNCEECGGALVLTQAWMRRAVIAHILPKNHFHSIETHPQNKWFGCLHCHTDYDNRGSQFVIKMKIYPRLREAVQNILLPLIPQEERRYIPEHFL